MDPHASSTPAGSAEVLRRMAAGSDPVPTLTLDAATPLRTLPPELVALVVGRTQAGASAFGADHPRAAITRQIVVPSGALAVLDAIGLVAAAVTGHGVFTAVAAVLLVLLGYLALAGARFVRADPLRVTPDQRRYVQAARTWRSARPWTDEQLTGPWGRLVGVAASTAGRIASSDAWTWASIARHRAETELAPTLDAVDADAFARAVAGEAVPSSATDTTPGARLVMRVAALLAYADELDDLARRASQDAGLRADLPEEQRRRLGDLLAVARERSAQ